MKYRVVTLFVAVTIAFTSVLSVGVPVADAQSDQNDAVSLAKSVLTADDPDSAYASLSPADQSAVDNAILSNRTREEFTTVGPAPQPDNPSLQSSTCWSRTKTITESTMGVPVYTFKQILNWCGDYNVVTSTNDWVEVSTGPFWRYNGVIDHWTTGGVGLTAYRVHRQAEFEYCPVGDCGWEFSYPIADQQGSADGSYWEN